MFKKEINFISDLNLNKLQILGNRFRVEDIKSSKIHPAILHYINGAIEKEILSDRKKIEENSIFNYSSDRISNYFSLISEEIKRIQNFDFEFVKQILEDAIIFNVNYLTKPNNTLTNFIFSNSEKKSIEEIIIGISHAYYYRYLQKILLTYFDKKKILFMEREEFKTLLKRVDSISKETHLEDSIVTAVNSMANFFDPHSKKNEQLPLPAIKLFLQEKNLSEFITKLENNYGINSTGLFLANDVITTLKSVTPESEIAIEETQLVEDELEVDIAHNNDELNISDPNLNISDNEIAENLEENNLQISEEIFESAENEIDIPNNEILSTDEVFEYRQNGDELIENSEDSTNTDISESESNITDDDIDKVSEENVSELNSDNVEEDSQKKKPEIQNLVKEVIDPNPVFEILQSPIIPFEDYDIQMDNQEILKDLSEETNYIIEYSSLKEEIDLSTTISDHDDSISFHSGDNIDEELHDFEDEQGITENKELESVENVFDNFENIDVSINNAIDDVVKEDISEKDEMILNESSESIEDIEENISEMENLIDDEKLNLYDDDDEEITEVFTDLGYLDNKDEIVEPIEENEINNDPINEEHEEINETNETESNQSEAHEAFSSFQEVLSSKDMTRIIESVFDYDMEDYHSLVNQISESNSETEAFQFTDEYCRINHIVLTSKEVETFKSLISEYFTHAIT